MEKTIPWGLVVESDEIWSERTERWYVVSGSVRIKDTDTVKVFIGGRQAGPPKPIKEMVLVRRGPTGDAVDVLQLIFSGQTMPDTEGTK